MRTLEQLFIDKRTNFVKLVKDFEGSYVPKTSWENMTDKALEEFKGYCISESSGFLKDNYENGNHDDFYILNEFAAMLWALALCIEQFDK